MDLPNKSEPMVSPTPKKEIHQVVSGAQPVKRPATRRVLDSVFAESPKAISGKIGRDILVPRLKAGFEEAVNSFVAGMLWGGGGRPLSNLVQGTVLRGGGINYNGVSSPTPALVAAQQNQSRASGAYQDLVVPTQQMAEALLANMYDLLNQYRVVAVGDLYELAGITAPGSGNAYGWTTLDGARISKTRDGYLLELPRPSLI